jgi:hypothetical protein
MSGSSRSLYVPARGLTGHPEVCAADVLSSFFLMIASRPDHRRFVPSEVSR